MTLATSRTTAFQSTLPRRERPGNPALLENSKGFQSTLPRRERLVLRPVFALPDDISIHAPAKGATTGVYRVSGWETFQSTLPRRERRREAAANKERVMISIHAPAKGATLLYSTQPCGKVISIHAPAKGATARSCC